MPNVAQDLLVRKEVMLGVLREMQPPQGHIGLRLLAPWQEVESDDVIFDYTRGLVAGLAPARAEDAESELAQKDDSVGSGRAAIIDWALKDHYDPSDVTRYRENLIIGQIAGAQSLPLALTGRATEGFEAKIARDTAIRRRKLDNRIEWLITQALENAVIVYNDGKIKFTVDYARPAGQTNAAAPGGLWSLTTSDPIGDILAMQTTMYNTYQVNMTRAITSRRVIHSVLNSSKFTTQLTGTNPLYTVTGWGYDAALEVVARATGVQFMVYDSVYRTRNIGSNTMVNTRFLSDNKIYFLPSEEDVNSIDDAIGFGKTLTSPHPEGLWTPGFYAWEQERVDPWGRDIGTGVKAFPVLTHMDLTYSMVVL